MIDYRELKSRRDEIAKNIADRNMKVDVDEAIRLQDKRSELMKAAEELRAARNENAQKMKGKMDNDARQALIAEGREIKEKIACTESELEIVDKDFNTIIRQRMRFITFRAREYAVFNIAVFRRIQFPTTGAFI